MLKSYPSGSRPLTGNDALKRVGDACLAIGRGVFSFEVVFVLFIFAGLYKADPRLAWFPVDLTLLLFIVSVGFGRLDCSSTRYAAVQEKPFRLSWGGAVHRLDVHQSGVVAQQNLWP